jgi:hypothetical protein
VAPAVLIDQDVVQPLPPPGTGQPGQVQVALSIDQQLRSARIGQVDAQRYAVVDSYLALFVETSVVECVAITRCSLAPGQVDLLVGVHLERNGLSDAGLSQQ